MRAIVVDDEPLMIQKFARLMEDIPDLNIVGQFDDSSDALEYVKKNEIEIAFLDIAMPGIDGILLAKELRKIKNNILIVFISAYDSYIRESNQIGVDYYLAKPYTKKALSMMMDKLRLLASRLQKRVFIQTFGRFQVQKDGRPIRLTGKAKEILALLTARDGKEVSNKEIYETLWEDRPYSNAQMSVYYNALRRLKNVLQKEGLADLMISTANGQMLNTKIADCDYYAWKNKNPDLKNRFEGEFLPEYSWGETILAAISAGEWE